jgi:hypothetical protein
LRGGRLRPYASPAAGGVGGDCWPPAPARRSLFSAAAGPTGGAPAGLCSAQVGRATRAFPDRLLVGNFYGQSRCPVPRNLAGNRYSSVRKSTDTCGMLKDRGPWPHDCNGSDQGASTFSIHRNLQRRSAAAVGEAPTTRCPALTQPKPLVRFAIEQGDYR